MIEETVPIGSTITYQGIDYTTEAEVNVLKVQLVDNSAVIASTDVPNTEVVDTPTSDPIVAPDAPQPSTEDVTITPGETLEVTEA